MMHRLPLGLIAPGKLISLHSGGWTGEHVGQGYAAWVLPRRIAVVLKTEVQDIWRVAVVDRPPGSQEGHLAGDLRDLGFHEHRVGYERPRGEKTQWLRGEVALADRSGAAELVSGDRLVERTEERAVVSDVHVHGDVHRDQDIAGTVRLHQRPRWCGERVPGAGNASDGAAAVEGDRAAAEDLRALHLPAAAADDERVLAGRRSQRVIAKANDRHLDEGASEAGGEVGHSPDRTGKAGGRVRIGRRRPGRTVVHVWRHAR